MSQRIDSARRSAKVAYLSMIVTALIASGCALSRPAEGGAGVWTKNAHGVDKTSVQRESPAIVSAVAPKHFNDAAAPEHPLETRNGYPPNEAVGEAMAPLTPSESATPRVAPPTVSTQETLAAAVQPPPTRIARMVAHANDATFEEEVLRSEEPVLVDFYADWCGPCKRLSPTLDAVAAERPQAKVVKVNIDESPNLAARYGLKSLPSLLVFKDGRAVARETGVASKEKVHSLLDL
jgi:thioredoxin 1